jgi:hypothetical protein
MSRIIQIVVAVFAVVLVTLSARATCISPNAVDSGPAINSALLAAGTGGTVNLCQGGFYPIQTTIRFQHANQMLTTEGLDAGPRARISINSNSLITAVDAMDVPGSWLKFVTVDGLADYWGQSCCGALLDFGGSVTTSGSRTQEIHGCEIREPRHWTAVHISAGNGGCYGVKVTNNDIGPAGTSTQWADGISYQCRDGLVTGNRVFDATDGGIVVFGAPGSIIADNRIEAITRNLFGGINMVDPGSGSIFRIAPNNDGDFRGTRVYHNWISATSAFIHIAIGSGPNVWWPTDGASAYQNKYCSEQFRNDGALIDYNTLVGDYMGYGFAVDGVKNWTITDNTDYSTHVYSSTYLSCKGQNAAPGGFQVYLPRSSGTFTGNSAPFVSAILDGALGITY